MGAGKHGGGRSGGPGGKEEERQQSAEHYIGAGWTRQPAEIWQQPLLLVGAWNGGGELCGGEVERPTARGQRRRGRAAGIVSALTGREVGRG